MIKIDPLDDPEAIGRVKSKKIPSESKLYIANIQRWDIEFNSEMF
jgi:hypothetical protein